ncbi:MAG: hypothetical protein A2541_00055 [Candidatus Taylorbacteria bacterium RIFOXYD2_FULL_36_9]|uniref:DUF4145 domain-containing protein n=1 Tax=Candidatus Taylorbacteria bacterium RIFOXYD2_FULL_36_9 TaxID=1802338 RepID=A0A1G2PF06_9BACT|nr:MAG: hypothetical protein A2541_00055 [Candidatus Taylorbacteria bacterium RIFOXYD2_FULL_36_9]
MSLPIEVQQLDTLHSVTLSPFFDSLIKAIYSNTLGNNWGDILKNFWAVLPDYAVAVMFRLFSFSFVLSLILIFAVIWSANGLMQTRKKMHDDLALPDQPVVKVGEPLSPVVNEKWQKVLTHINSVNQSDWKLAILECDIMLSEILEKMGYMQESIGEKLKVVESSDFLSIESAWEAHKIRNAIAHEGSEFMINEREAKRVIGLYEVVFREFKYI